MRKMVRNLESIEACKRVIRKRKRKNEHLEKDINNNINIINECKMRIGQIKNNSRFQDNFLDGFDVKKNYIARGVEMND